MTDQQYPIVEVHWVDSSTTHGWSKDYSPADLRCKSIGYLIREEEDRITLTDSLSLNRLSPADISPDHFHCYSEIPRGAITKVRYLKKVRKSAT